MPTSFAFDCLLISRKGQAHHAAEALRGELLHCVDPERGDILSECLPTQTETWGLPGKGTACVIGGVVELSGQAARIKSVENAISRVSKCWNEDLYLVLAYGCDAGEEIGVLAVSAGKWTPRWLLSSDELVEAGVGAAEDWDEFWGSDQFGPVLVKLFAQHDCGVDLIRPLRAHAEQQLLAQSLASPAADPKSARPRV